MEGEWIRKTARAIYILFGEKIWRFQRYVPVRGESMIVNYLIYSFCLDRTHVKNTSKRI